jgi:hypothetical protein
VHPVESLGGFVAGRELDRAADLVGVAADSRAGLVELLRSRDGVFDTEPI